MKPKQKHISFTHYFFILLLTCGAALLIYSYSTGEHDDIFAGLRLIAFGILLIGTGEWINHPLQKSITFGDQERSSFIRIRHRKRNPSVLGNLLEIAGLLLIFAGLADFV